MTFSALRQFGQEHPIATRWIIGALLFLVASTAFCLGMFVIGTGWYEAQWPLWMTFAGIGGLFWIQYRWTDQAPNRRMWFAFHISAIFLFALLNVHIGSRFTVKYGGDLVETSLLEVSASAASQSGVTEIEEGGKQKSWLRRMIRKARRSVNEMPIWAKILLTIGATALVVVVGYFVGFLACALACSEMGFLAAVVIIAGWGGLIVGGFFLIRRIWRGKPAQAT